MNKDYIEISKETLLIEATTLISATELLDENIEKAIEIILQTKGKLIVTGVGKSGLIGAKIAATLASTGTPSFFLHPTEAMHGDLGMISEGDSVLAISYSGESSELSQILPHIKRFDIPLISMSKSNNSTLASNADVNILLNVQREACPLDIAPTSSTTLTLALGDALAICLMKARDFKKEDFASFHPGGALGKKLFVKVKDIMRKDELPVCKKDDSIRDVILKITQGKLGTAIVVDDENHLEGILSDGDIRRALLDQNFSLEHTISTYAQSYPFYIDEPDMLASKALELIEDKKIQIAIITNKNKKVLGALHLHTLVEKGIS